MDSVQDTSSDQWDKLPQYAQQDEDVSNIGIWSFFDSPLKTRSSPPTSNKKRKNVTNAPNVEEMADYMPTTSNSNQIGVDNTWDDFTLNNQSIDTACEASVSPPREPSVEEYASLNEQNQSNNDSLIDNGTLRKQMQELERRLSREKTENIRLNNLLGEYSNASESYMKKSEALSKEYKKTFDKLKLEFRLQKDTIPKHEDWGRVGNCNRSVTNGKKAAKARMGREPTPEFIDGKKTYEVEAVVDKRIVDGDVQYKIKWKGYKRNTWQPEEDLMCDDCINEFERTLAQRQDRSLQPNNSSKAECKQLRSGRAVPFNTNVSMKYKSVSRRLNSSFKAPTVKSACASKSESFAAEQSNDVTSKNIKIERGIAVNVVNRRRSVKREVNACRDFKFTSEKL
ncbi:chromo (CHRromatin organization MOdifier) domain-containing protein [Ditylenchus destructor]|uniref:Chromo (CHRromatin organization MOdifier) domain-containing protein n=1 Tax=Ditylenchus destructor TaxID=166010 RepID=A0AAD4MUK4_9BILA|nr:chromo (CHRromatin organization MOdifier) domain-containing protein [Ditylenchus destructor]